MAILTTILILLVAFLHLWFLALEMFLWQKPIGLKTFKNTPEKAEATAVLAANQGLYNGFLAAGLIASLAFNSIQVAFAFQVFFLSCVIVAALYGAYSVNKRIFIIQGIPALLALAAVFYQSTLM